MGSAGDLAVREGRALGPSAEHTPPSSVWLYECIAFPRSFDVEAHAPNDRLSNGEGPMLNEALMCIIYLFKWSVPALHPAPLLRLLCHY